MIQDIGPHRYDRSYSLTPAQASDYALCYRKGSVLLRLRGGEYELPRFGESAVSTEGTRHLFSLDGTGCYLTPAPDKDPEGCVWLTMQEVRQVRPMAVAFAAVTGAQLDRWYRDRSYCGRCGAPMEPGTAERSMVCPRCGLTEYPKICPAVIVAVTDGDRLVLTRYAGRPYRGDALIAGFMEIGETPEDTVRREVMEEVGLRVKNIRYYKSQPWSFTDTLLMGFYCDLDGDDTIRIDESELKEGFWQRRDEISPRAGDVSLTSEMVERFRMGKE